MQEILRACLRVEGILYEGLGRSVRLGIVRGARVRVPPGAVGLRRRPCLGGPVRLLTVNKRTGLPPHPHNLQGAAQGEIAETQKPDPGPRQEHEETDRGTATGFYESVSPRRPPCSILHPHRIM